MQSAIISNNVYIEYNVYNTAGMQLFDKLFWQEKVSFIATSTSFDVQQVGEIFLAWTYSWVTVSNSAMKYFKMIVQNDFCQEPAFKGLRCFVILEKVSIQLDQPATNSWKETKWQKLE